MEDDDDDEGFGSPYENGHWIWDDSTEAIVFVSDLPLKLEESIVIPQKAPTGTVEFRDDVDLLEQIRFRRRYQRKLKPGQSDIITLQDVKDIALFTAPLSLLSPALISILHMPTTERLIRALILCCQYYLQTTEEMTRRIIEMETKIRTPDCELLEQELRENLSDLRLLVAKEYSTLLVGGDDMRKFHHMGPHKKRRSLADKDARLFETFLRMCVQIVWLALGRKSFNQIELEINRMFKSDIFNIVEHNLRTGYITKMAKEERTVLLGGCLRHDKKLNTYSPLINEVFCHRQIDYRYLALGLLKFPGMDPRVQYMMTAVAAPEDSLQALDVVLGIIGQRRSTYDTMLRPLPAPSDSGKSKSKASMSFQSQTAKSSQSTRKSTAFIQKLYPDIVLPHKGIAVDSIPPNFPTLSVRPRACSDVQRRRWQQRLARMLKPQTKVTN